MSTVDVPPKVGLESAGVRMTPEEFDAIEEYDEIYCYELIDGVLFVSPFAGLPERGPNQLLGNLLWYYKEHHPQGSALDATHYEQYLYVPNGRRRADRAIWAGLGRQPNSKTDVPTIVIEFVSAGRASFRRDYEEKRREYLAIGVVEYWIIDRFRRTMTVYRNQPDKQPEEIIEEQQSYKPEPLPGFELPLASLLAEADACREGS